MNPLAFLVAGVFFMELLDGTIITTALPQMAVSLGTRAVDLNVGISAYLLTLAVFILPGGWAAERYGARPVFTAAIGVFTLGSALCGLAVSTETFVAARVLQGLGGAMMVPVGRLVVLRTTAKPALMRAIATLTWPGLTAPLLGPPLGGFIAEHLHWRYIFLVNIPLGLLAILLAWRMVPPIAPAGRRAFDGVGFVLAGSGILCATLALDVLGGADPPWAVAAGLVAGTVAAGLGLARHLHRHAQPLIDPAPWSVPTFRLVMVGGTAMRLLIAALPFLLPLLFQLGLGYDPFHAGLMLLALFAGNLGMKPLTSPVLRRWGFRTVLAGNGLLQAAAMLGCSLVGPETPLLAVVPLLVVAGASRSMQFTALNTLAFSDVQEAAMAAANTWFSVAFQLASGLGVAVGALTLRLAGTVAGGPVLLAFHWTFASLAVLMAAAAVTGFQLEAGAGAAVSGHQVRTSPAPPRAGPP